MSSKNLHILFEDYLTSNDGRYTSQKKTIITAIEKLKGHFEVEDFIDQFRKNEKLSRATVYRTIKQLLDAGLLQKISTRDGKIYYEKSNPQKEHTHLICNICGKIFELKEPEMDKIIQKYCHKIGFLSQYQSIHIYGQCKSCQK